MGEEKKYCKCAEAKEKTGAFFYVEFLKDMHDNIWCSSCELPPEPIDKQ